MAFIARSLWLVFGTQSHRCKILSMRQHTCVFGSMGVGKVLGPRSRSRQLPAACRMRRSAECAVCPSSSDTDHQALSCTGYQYACVVVPDSPQKA